MTSERKKKLRGKTRVKEEGIFLIAWEGVTKYLRQNEVVKMVDINSIGVSCRIR